MKRQFAIVLITLAILSAAPGARAADEVKVGILRISASGPIFIAEAKGYFATEGLAEKHIFFDSPVPIGQGMVSGDIDIAPTGNSAALYNLAGQGALRIIAAQGRETPTFQGQVLAASNRAYAAGLKSFPNLPGHSITFGPIGTQPHYALSLVADKLGIDMNSLRIVALPGISETIAALVGGSVDATISASAAAMPAIAKGDAKLAGRIADQVRWQTGSVWTTTRTANERRDVVERFLRAYKRGVRDYHDAFTDASERREDQVTSTAVLAIIADALNQSPELLRNTIPYIDPEARLDAKDILRQIAWYRSQGMVKGEFDPASVIDMRYVVPLPEK